MVLQKMFGWLTCMAVAGFAFSDGNGTNTENSVKAPAEVVEAGKIVVTASRRKTPLKDSPVMVTRISREELENSPETTIDEFLNRIPDISSKRSHVAECGPGRELTLRGMPDQRRTLVLLDGIPINDGFSGAVNWSVIPKGSVEAIEIVHGPMSALYGSGAMGGVINIITKLPSEPSETVLRGSYGTDNTYSTFLSQGGTGEKHGYYISGNFYETDGYMKVKDPQPYHVDNERTDWSLMGKYFYFPDPDSMLTLSAYAVDETYSRGRIFTEQDNEMFGGQVTYERETESGGSLSGSLYGNYNYRKVEVSGPQPDYDSLEHTEADNMYRFGQLFKASVPLNEIHMLTMGFDSSLSMFDKENEYMLEVREASAEGKQTLFSLFAQDEATFRKEDHKVIMSLGFRGDYCRSYDGEMFDSGIGIDEKYDEKSWSAINPKAGLVYQYADFTTLRAGVGRSFAAPTLSGLYTVFRRGPVTMNGNPDLEPETSFTFNLGADQKITEKITARIDGYYTKGEDFISSREIAVNTYMSDNISKVEIIGADVELRCRFTDELSTYVGYAHTESTILEDEFSPANEGNEVAFQPQHKGRVGLSYLGTNGFRGDLSANYVGERYTSINNTDDNLLEDYVSLDLILAKDIRKNMTVSLGFENMLDKQYELYSLPLDESYAPGRQITVSLEVRL